MVGSEFSKETIGAFLDHVKGKVIEESKNIGRSLAAALQPRDAAGRFIKDSSKMRNWLTSNAEKNTEFYQVKFLEMLLNGVEEDLLL